MLNRLFTRIGLGLVMVMMSTQIQGDNSPSHIEVAVIGAGLSGLTVAHRLEASGMSVNVYEARSRVGGRVLSVKIGDAIGELGRQSVGDGGESHYLRRLVKEFGLNLNRQTLKLNHHYFDGEDLLSLEEEIERRGFDIESLQAQLEDRAKDCATMQDVLESFLEKEDPLYQALALKLSAYEGGEVDKLSSSYVETLTYALSGGLSSAHRENEVELVTIEGGSANLPLRMAQKLEGSVHLNKALVKVAKEGDGYKLQFADKSVVICDILVLTLPCSVYENIIFDPKVIGSDRLKKIQSVSYGTNAKMLFGIEKVKDNPIGLLGKGAVGFANRDGVMTYYCSGDTSCFAPESVSEIFYGLQAQFQRGYEEIELSTTVPVYADDKLFSRYDDGVAYSWPNDPFAKGSYSYVGAGQEEILGSTQKVGKEEVKTLFAPVGHRLYFAGEHTTICDDVLGTMEAACESGERIARMIVESKEKKHVN